MAFFSWATYPTLCLVPAFVFLGMADGRGDALQRERVAIRQRFVLWNWLVAAVAVVIVKVAIANREIMGMVRWKRVLLRGLLLLSIGLHAASCFMALDTAADMLLRGGDDSSKAVTSACAVVAVTTHLPIGWTAVFGD